MPDPSAYLARLNYHGPTTPTLATLRALHLAHLYTVPFENLDIHLGCKIILEEERLFDKIVNQRRGGYCYELNGLFAWLLDELGFNVSRLSAGVWQSGNQRFGPAGDHLCLLVQFETEGRWLADVGFGECFREPLPLDNPNDQIQFGKTYRLTAEGDHRIMWELDAEGKPADGYRFTLQPHRLYDFTYGNHYMQTSPDSGFARKLVCTRATPQGRFTLSDLKLITTTNGRRDERTLASQLDQLHILRDCFDINLPSESEFKSPLQ